MTNFNFKKIIGAIGAFVALTPATLSIVACQHDSEKKVDKKNQKIKSLEAQITKLQQDIKALKTTLTKYQAMANQASQNLANKDQEINKLKEDIALLKSDLASEKALDQDAQKKVQILEEQIKDKTNKLKDLTKEYDGIQAQLQVITSELAAKLKEVDALVSQENDLKLQLNQLSSETLITSAIKNSIYHMQVKLNSNIQNITPKINANFISQNLTKAAKDTFNNNLFTMKAIFNENGQALSSEDFKIAGNLYTQVIYNYGNQKEQSATLIFQVIASDQDITSIIDQKIYQKKVFLNSNVKDLKNAINGEFIGQALPKFISHDFNSNLLQVEKLIINNSEKELTDGDLQTIGQLNIKVVYNYGSQKNHTTALNLFLVSENRLELTDVFKDFKFWDIEGAEGFLDSNNQSYLEQIFSRHLSITNLKSVGLTLTNLHSNAVTIKANPNSKYYYGQKTLTWNLKLFKIWGTPVGGSVPYFSKGLKGCFYLDSKTQKIKYFDQYYYFSPGYHSHINISISHYHEFTFSNSQNEKNNFIFHGNTYTNEIEKLFNAFNFKPDVKVTVKTPEPSRVKLFNLNSKQWEGLNVAANSEVKFIIDSQGRINFQ